jgi:hypothetical protein
LHAPASQKIRAAAATDAPQLDCAGGSRACAALKDLQE